MNFRDRFLTRRELLQRSGMGMGAVGEVPSLDVLSPQAHGVDQHGAGRG